MKEPEVEYFDNADLCKCGGNHNNLFESAEGLNVRDNLKDSFLGHQRYMHIAENMVNAHFSYGSLLTKV
jgi:hypothetical protein